MGHQMSQCRFIETVKFPTQKHSWGNVGVWPSALPSSSRGSRPCLLMFLGGHVWISMHWSCTFHRATSPGKQVLLSGILWNWRKSNAFHLLRKVLVSSTPIAESGNRSCFLLSVHVKPVDCKIGGCLERYFEGTHPHVVCSADLLGCPCEPMGQGRYGVRGRPCVPRCFVATLPFLLVRAWASIATPFMYDAPAFSSAICSRCNLAHV